jgi:hypothetical protein
VDNGADGVGRQQQWCSTAGIAPHSDSEGRPGTAPRRCAAPLPGRFDVLKFAAVRTLCVQCRIRSFSDSGTPAAAFPFSDLEFPAENASTPFESFVPVFACLLVFDQSESSEKCRWHIVRVRTVLSSHTLVSLPNLRFALTPCSWMSLSHEPSAENSVPTTSLSTALAML